MKFKVTMKDPDALLDAIKDAVQEEANERRKTGNFDEKEIEMLREYKVQKTYDQVKKWFEFGEYLTVEIDIVEDTCTVLKKDY